LSGTKGEAKPVNRSSKKENNLARYTDAVCRLCRREGIKLRNYFENAVRFKGVTGAKLLEQLERRLDNVVYRLGFGISRRQARQLVRHGHVQVNGKKVNIPSYEVGVGEEIAIREGSKKVPILEIARDFASHQPAPAWLEIDRENYKGRVLALPKREDIQLPVNEQLIVELYSK
jgi:small subunit ribosomal protein S4